MYYCTLLRKCSLDLQTEHLFILRFLEQLIHIFSETFFTLTFRDVTETLLSMSDTLTN